MAVIRVSSCRRNTEAWFVKTRAKQGQNGFVMDEVSPDHRRITELPPEKVRNMR